MFPNLHKQRIDKVNSKTVNNECLLIRSFFYKNFADFWQLPFPPQNVSGTPGLKKRFKNNVDLTESTNNIWKQVWKLFIEIYPQFFYFPTFPIYSNPLNF